MSIKYQSVYRWISFLLLLHLLCLATFYLVIGIYVAGGRGHQAHLLDLSGRPVGSDFVTYWAASKVARTQGPAAVFSRERIYAAEREVIGTAIMPRIWNYPPTFLLMALPLAALPYLASLICWLTVTGLGYLAVIRGIIPRGPIGWLFILFPGAVSNVLYGQNGFLSAAFLGGGLLFIDRYPFLGGGLLGLLSYKPQLAVLLPLALAAGKHWKALAGAVISAGGLEVASLAVLGSGVWSEFFRNLPLATNLMNRDHLWEKMPTIFAAARLAGAGQEQAIAVQAVATLGAVFGVTWVWYRHLPLALRGSALALGIILVTPYAFAYDLTILALPVAWLGAEAYGHGDLGEVAVWLLAWTLLAWAALKPPWVWQGGLYALFSLTALLVMTGLVVYRTAKFIPPRAPASPG